MATPAPVRVRLDAQEALLDNGLRLLTLQDRTAPVVSYQVHYAVGSRNERPGITGMAHLFEHMMFKGTPSVGPEEFAHRIQQAGGQLNAFTTEDNTSYYENLPAEALPLAIQLEADRQGHLLLSEENLAAEREVVRNERLLRTVNTPYGLGREMFIALAFPRHPYGWPVVGWDSDLRALTLEDCRAFFSTYYAPNNTTVVVVGDLDHDDVLARVREAYAPLPSAPPPPRVVTLEEPQTGERRALHRHRVEAAALFAGYHVPEVTHADCAALLVLSAVLSEGESARFFRRFVHPGRAAMVASDVGLSFLNMDPSLFRVEAILNPGDDPAALEVEIWEELDRLLEDGVTEQEVRRAIRQITAALVLQARTCFYRGLQLGLYQIRAGDWRWLHRLTDRLAEVSGDDILRVARTYLQADNRTVLTVMPEGS